MTPDCRDSADEQRRVVHCLELADEWLRAYGGPNQEAFLARMQGEHDTLRAALGWLAERAEQGAEEETDEALRLASKLRTFWVVGRHVAEGRAWLRRLLAAPSAQAPTAARAWALDNLGALAFFVEDYAEANAPGDESLPRDDSGDGDDNLVYACSVAPTTPPPNGNPRRPAACTPGGLEPTGAPSAPREVP